jgi:hypothetical protein
MTENVDHMAGPARPSPRTGATRGRPDGKRQGGGFGRIAIFVIILLLLGAAASWRELRPYVAPVVNWISAHYAAPEAKPRDQAPSVSTVPADNAAMLEQALASAAIRLELVERRLAAVEAHIRQQASLRAKDEPDLAKHITPPANALRGEVPSENGAAGNPASAEDKAETKKRRNSERSPKGALMLMSARQLREAVDRGTPFETEFQVVQTLGGEWIGDTLTLLAPHAAIGIPTRAVLAEKFKPLAAQALSAQTQAGGNWLEGRVSQILSSAIVVRKIDTAGDGGAAAIRRSERLLAEGDFNGGVDALRSLQGASAGILTPWLQAALARSNADRALSEVISTAIAMANESGE